VKQCSKCKIKKKNSEFNKQTKSKDGMAVWCRVCMNSYDKNYRDTKAGYLINALSSAKNRAKNKKVDFQLDLEYLQNIATKTCPVFGVDLLYASSKNGAGYPNIHAASLDRIIPELGYVKGNVVFISNYANLIKSNATEVELYAVADWLHDKRKEVLNAFKIKPSPVSAGDHIPGAVGAELGSVSTPWTWKDSDNADHHCGTIREEDFNYRTKASSGDSVGRRGAEVGTSKTLEGFKDYWQSREKTRRIVG
jgi:hypothetical protein